MKPKFELGSNYKYIISVWKKRSTVTNHELLECIKSQCDPQKIITASIENGHNQVGILGSLIEEIGNRKIIEAAPIIVEFIAWPYFDDFWVHLVPNCYKALCMIGDVSIINRLLDITSADTMINRTLELLNSLDKLNNKLDHLGKLNINPLEDIRARVIMISHDEALLSKEQVQKWADNIIMESEDAPPDWVFDLSMHGKFDFRNAPEDPPIVIHFNERLLCIVAFYKIGGINIETAIGKLLNILDESPVGKVALFSVLECNAFQSSPIVQGILSQIEESFEKCNRRNPEFRQVLMELIS